jgi:chloramphenicol 3-O phosphotransferase
VTPGTGRVVVLNGAPRSGKTTLARALQASAPGRWMHLGVDASVTATPPRLQPGIGLRPGGERPDLEEAVVLLYVALYDAVAAHARLGFDVVVDTGHHESYSQPRHVLRTCARRLVGMEVLFVGVRCALDEVWERRRVTWGHDCASAEPELVAAVQRWQDAVHAAPYDLEVDTGVATPDACAARVVGRLADGPPGTAFARLAAAGDDDMAADGGEDAHAGGGEDADAGGGEDADAGGGGGALPFE